MRKITVTEPYIYVEEATQQGLWGPEIPGKSITFNEGECFDITQSLVPYSEEEGIITPEGFLPLSRLPQSIYSFTS